MMAMAPANIVCTTPPCLGPPGTAENGDRGANTDKRWRRRKRKEDKHMMEGRETD